MKLSALATVILAMLICTEAHGRYLAASSSSSERGFFSIHGSYGSTWSRLLNEDGTHASYRGSDFGLGLDIRVGSGGPGEFRLFAVNQWTSEKGQQDANSKLTSSQTYGGFKIFTNNHLYIGVGFGQSTQNLNQNGVSSKMTNPILTGGIGLEFQIFESIYAGLDFWYKNNPIKNTTDLGGNSFSESGVVQLRLIYSPASTTINNIVNSR